MGIKKRSLAIRRSGVYKNHIQVIIVERVRPGKPERVPLDFCGRHEDNDQEQLHEQYREDQEGERIREE